MRFEGRLPAVRLIAGSGVEAIMITVRVAAACEVAVVLACAAVDLVACAVVEGCAAEAAKARANGTI